MRRFRHSTQALVVAACLGFTGCAEIGDPDIGSPPTSVSPAETAPVDGTNPDGSTNATTPQLPPSRPDGFVPSLVVATESGVVLVPDGGQAEILDLEIEVEPLVDQDDPGTPLLAIDDFFRGLVVESTSGRVMWFPAEGGSARRINVDDGRLLDVGFFNGTTEAIVAVGSQIDRVRLADLQRFQLLSLTPNQELLDFSAGGGLYVSAIADTECGELRFINALGEQVPVTLPEVPPCEIDRRPFYGSVALSSDGGAVAYTNVTYRSDGIEASTELVVVDLSTGGVVLETEVGSSGDRVTGLSFDGQRVAMLREAANSDVELVLVNDAEVLAGPDLTRFGALAGVTWSRLPVAVGTES